METFNPGFEIGIGKDKPDFHFGEHTFAPAVEFRTLDSIRQSLRNPDCAGPDIVYAIAMDIGKQEHRQALERRMLLFGAVTYAVGRLGDEPIRSQGHIHKVSAHSGWSPPEVYEIWTGKAFIYMQEQADEYPGRCFAVLAEPGDIVVVPPAWAHATISADPGEALTFGALCDREYGFEYDEVRKRQGLAWYPILHGSAVKWEANPNYMDSKLTVKKPREYDELDIQRGRSIYEQFAQAPDRLQWVSKPQLKQQEWQRFIP